MDNENNDALNGESNSEDNIFHEDIPLWLQGIENTDNEDTILPNNENDVTDQWIKEIPEEVKEQKTLNNDYEDAPQKEAVNPNWKEADSENPSDDLPDLDNDKNQNFDSEELNNKLEENISIEKENVFEVMNANEDLENTQDSNEVKPAEDDFIEISDSDIFDEDHPNQDKSPLDDKELPYWLQDMIAEPADNENIEKQPEAEEIEGFLEEENVIETDMAENLVLDDNFPSQEFKQEKGKSQMDDVETRLQNLTEWITEDNTKPVFVQNETMRESEVPGMQEDVVMEEIEENELVHAVEMPDKLQKAKFLLDEGKYPEALDAIINACQEKTVYQNEVRSWLMTIAQKDTVDKSEVWEAIGDIELNEANSKEALNAYTKAIQTLLGIEKEIDEID